MRSAQFPSEPCTSTARYETVRDERCQNPWETALTRLMWQKSSVRTRDAWLSLSAILPVPIRTFPRTKSADIKISPISYGISHGLYLKAPTVLFMKEILKNMREMTSFFEKNGTI